MLGQLFRISGTEDAHERFCTGHVINVGHVTCVPPFAPRLTKQANQLPTRFWNLHFVYLVRPLCVLPNPAYFGNGLAWDRPSAAHRVLHYTL